MKHIGAALLLLLAGVFGLLAWTVETCTGNAPDSLFGGLLVLPLNLLGMTLLAVRPRLLPSVAVLLVPVLMAFLYTTSSIEFIYGYATRSMSACEAITGYSGWEPSGDEPFLAGLWGAVVLIFWGGLMIVAWRGHRASMKDVTVEQPR